MTALEDGRPPFPDGTRLTVTCLGSPLWTGPAVAAFDPELDAWTVTVVDEQTPGRRVVIPYAPADGEPSFTVTPAPAPAAADLADAWRTFALALASHHRIAVSVDGAAHRPASAALARAIARLQALGVPDFDDPLIPVMPRQRTAGDEEHRIRHGYQREAGPGAVTVGVRRPSV